MKCIMQYCKAKAFWKAIPTKKRIKSGCTPGFYCNSCKRYHQSKNNNWSRFEKLIFSDK